MLYEEKTQKEIKKTAESLMKTIHKTFSRSVQIEEALGDRGVKQMNKLFKLLLPENKEEGKGQNT